MTNNRLYAVLAYSGTLPFAACALLLAAAYPPSPVSAVGRKSLRAMAWP